MSGRKRWFGLLGGLAVMLVAVAAVLVVHAVRKHEEEGDTPLAFCARAPVVGAAAPPSRSSAKSSSTARRRSGRRSPGRRRRRSTSARSRATSSPPPRPQDGRQAFVTQSAAGLADSFAEVGPFVPRVPARVTYTGAPTTNSGRVTALAIDPNCGRPGRGCRAWMAAAGGGIWRTDDALAASVAGRPDRGADDRRVRLARRGPQRPDRQHAVRGLRRAERLERLRGRGRPVPVDRRWEDVVARPRPRRGRARPLHRLDRDRTRTTGRCGSAPTSRATARRRPTAAGARRPARRSSASRVAHGGASFTLSTFSLKAPTNPSPGGAGEDSSRAASTRSSSTRAASTTVYAAISAAASGAPTRHGPAATRLC